MFGLERITADGSERLLALFNVTSQPQSIRLTEPPGVDLLTGERLPHETHHTVELSPYQVRWLTQNG